MTIPTNAKKAALRRARELREQFRARGEFHLADFREECIEALQPFREAAYDGFIDHVVETIDKESIRERDGEQPLLDPSWDIEGEYRLGNGRRIAKALAQLIHLEEMIANDEKNAALVLSASARKHEELTKLRPYLGPGVTKQQAIEAYLRDHPTPNGER